MGTLWKSLLLAVCSVALFLGLTEAALWAAGVEPLIAERDPFRGFSGRLDVYALDEEADVYRTRPRALHSFNPQAFDAQKPANGFRVFVLGGSSAFGFPWGAEESFSKRLEEGLAAAWPTHAIEVVNAGAMSYGSHRLRILVPELLAYAPDLLVVYSGHNEFVERHFYRDQLSRSTAFDGLREWLYRWRLYAWGTRAYERALVGSASPSDTGDAAVGEQLGLHVDRQSAVVEPEEVHEVVRRFEENLRALLDTAQTAGVPVLLCTVPSNLRDWVANESAFGAEVSPGAQRTVEAELRQASARLAGGDAAGAVLRLERARERAPRHAEVHYRLGQAYEALGRWDEAREAYVRSRDYDARPTRAVSALNDVLRQLAAERDVPLVDVERIFERASPHGIYGFELIEDYVHPSIEGHRLIAREVWNRILRGDVGGPAREPAVVDFDVALASVPSPAAPLAADDERTARLLFNQAVVLENHGSAEEALEKYRAALALRPGYVAAQLNAARLLYRQGDLPAAQAEYQLALDRSAGGHLRVRALVGLGRVLQASGDASGARDRFAEATRLAPDSVEAWNALGETLARRHRLAQAEAAFRRAAALDGENPEVAANLGSCLLLQHRLEEAHEIFRAARGRNPAHTRTRNGLASTLTQLGRYEEAEGLFRESLARDPSDPTAREGLRLLARLRG